MRRSTILVWGFASILVVSAGCSSGGSNSVTAPPAGTQITISVPPPVYAGTTIQIYVSAFNDQKAVTSMAIDFTDDGTWDDTRTFDRSRVSATFYYSFPTEGTYTVRVQATDADNVVATKTLTVFVTVQQAKLVTYTMYARSDQGGDCGAIDPPAECTGCTEILTSAGVTKTLGSYQSGMAVNLSQAFVQGNLTAGRLTYSCSFDVSLRAGAPGNQVLIDSGACTTSSTMSPPLLKCFITVGGTVP